MVDQYFCKKISTMLLGDLLNALAPVLGEKPDSDEMKKLLLSKEIATANVPDVWRDKLGGLNGLMSVEAAKNNEAIRDHHYALFGNIGDSSLERLIPSLGLDEETVKEIKSEKKTFARFEKALLKIKELADKKGENKADDKKIKDEVAALHKQLADAAEAQKQALAQVNSTWHDKLKGIEIEKVIGSFDFGVDLPKDVLIQTARNLVEKKAAEKKYKVAYNGDNNAISLKTESDLDVFENNQPVSYQTFASSVLAENKLLKVGGPKTPATPAQVITNGQTASKSLNTSKFDQVAAEIAAEIPNN